MTDTPAQDSAMSQNADQTAASESGTPAGEKTEAEILAVIDALNAENASLKDKLLRAMADMENLRRRTEKEIADARLYAVTNFARDMLNVADNTRRGLESVPADQRESADGAFKALIDGVELTERDLLNTLERHGIKKLHPEGERFDPNRHEALFEIENADVPSGTVLQVMQSGFVIGDRVLRPARVGVSKGGPKQPASGRDPQN
jgi:molecular chaperone GrpE